MAWTDDRVDLLKKLWAEGLSASQIAGRLGSVTRNAVIGKVHRLGLSGRATTSRMKSHRPRQRMASKRLAKSRYATIGNPALRALYNAETNVYLPPTEELVIPVAERRSIQTLTEVTCRWPIGDPQQPAKNRCIFALASQEESRSWPESTTKSAAATPTVVPKLEPECLRHLQQWQQVTGPSSSPRIA